MQFTQFNLDKSLITKLPRTHESPFDYESQFECRFYFMADRDFVCFNDQALSLTSLHTANEKVVLPEHIIRHFYLGFDNNNQHVFVIVVSSLDQLSFGGDLTALSLRDIADAKHDDTETVSILAYANHLNYWLAFHSFCSRCGHKLELHRQGHMQYCPVDKREFYPRINPAVIVQISYKDKLFLARQPHWPEKRFSVAAGFVEPGETFEQTVIREMKEETNLDMINIHYLSSQPWAFPNAMMIGFTANATSFNHNVEDDELSEGIWLTIDELIQKVRDDVIHLPTDISISYHLIDDWVIKQTGQSLQKHLC